MRRAALALLFALAACGPQGDQARRPRLCMVVGVDVSGSFTKGGNYDDSLNFLAHYLHAHMNGLGGLEVPDALFVGSIGGSKTGEAKTMFPKQTFEGKAPEAILAELKKIFPPESANPLTDFNAFFEQAAGVVRERNLLLRPIVLVMLSDGKPAFGKDSKEEAFRKIAVAPLENLSRSVTLRLLYTDAETGKQWRDAVPRRRVKVWTQDAAVMKQWTEPHLLVPGKPFDQQDKLFMWIAENVDFAVRSKRVQ